MIVLSLYWESLYVERCSLYWNCTQKIKHIPHINIYIYCFCDMCSCHVYCFWNGNCSIFIYQGGGINREWIGQKGLILTLMVQKRKRWCWWLSAKLCWILRIHWSYNRPALSHRYMIFNIFPLVLGMWGRQILSSEPRQFSPPSLVVLNTVYPTEYVHHSFVVLCLVPNLP